MSVLIVIPARWGSTRLPGKPLAVIAGKTLLQRVVEVASVAAAHRPGTRVLIATDDQRVADHGRAIGQEVAMTASDLDSGTARALAAANATVLPAAAVINLQGDAPFTSPLTLLAIIDALAAGAQVATPLVQLDWAALDHLRRHKASSPFSGTTCVRGADGRALWFSKQILPAIRDEAAKRSTSRLSPVFRHVGVYGYTLDALSRFCAAPPSANERIEGLEQLRFLELQVPVQTVVVKPGDWSMSGIDTPEDLALANSMIVERGEPDWA